MDKLTFLLIILPITSIAQVTDFAHSKEGKISFSYNKQSYEKSAVDSVKRLYDDQDRYFQGNYGLKENYISKSYKWEELSLVSIPYFRIAKIASQIYDCESNIENFIEFEERNKYQKVLIFHKHVAIKSVIIPDINFEMERIHNPDAYIKTDNSYYAGVLQSFQVDKNYHKNYTELQKKNSDNFFFGIFGLGDVIFEVDAKSGVLYAYKMGWVFEKYLANQYIRQNAGMLLIREIAKGIYYPIDGIDSLEAEFCKEDEHKVSKIVFKVKKLE
jgi:hypothetical protein